MSPSADTELNAAGSCLCKGVKFSVRGQASNFYTCYCSRCRKETGSAFAANIIVPVSALTWISGQESVSRYELPESEYFCLDFCATCGSPVPYLGRNRQFYIVPAGSLNTEPDISPRARIFWADRATWVDEAASCPSFDGYD